MAVHRRGGISFRFERVDRLPHPSTPPSTVGVGWPRTDSILQGNDAGVVKEKNPEFRIQNPGGEAGILTPEFWILNSLLFSPLGR
jgi:hypothetical protein